jgi:hypothetical protein
MMVAVGHCVHKREVREGLGVEYLKPSCWRCAIGNGGGEWCGEVVQQHGYGGGGGISTVLFSGIQICESDCVIILFQSYRISFYIEILGQFRLLLIYTIKEHSHGK